MVVLWGGVLARRALTIPPIALLRSTPPPPRRGIRGIIKMVSQSVTALHGTGGGSGRSPLKKLRTHLATYKGKKIRPRIDRPRIHSATHPPTLP